MTKEEFIKGVSEGYTEIIERVIRIYFSKETDGNLLTLFRAYAEILTNEQVKQVDQNLLDRIDKLTDEQLAEELINSLPDISVRFNLMNVCEEYYQKNYSHITDSPHYKTSRIEAQIRKFFIALSAEFIKELNLTDEHKLEVYNADLHGIEQYLRVHQSPEVTAFAQPHVEFLRTEILFLQRKISLAYQSKIDKPRNKIAWTYSLDIRKKVSQYLNSKNITNDFEKLFSDNAKIDVNSDKLLDFLTIMRLLTQKKAFTLDNGKGYLNAIIERIQDTSSISNYFKKSKPSQIISNLNRKNPLKAATLKAYIIYIDAAFKPKS